MNSENYINKTPDAGESRYALDDQRLCFLSKRISSGNGTSYSFDIEEAEDSHYILNEGDFKLLCDKLGIDPIDAAGLAELIRVGIKNAPDKGHALVKFLNDNSVIYRQFHFDS